jgi:hypothetical protein
MALIDCYRNDSAVTIEMFAAAPVCRHFVHSATTGGLGLSVSVRFLSGAHSPCNGRWKIACVNERSADVLVAAVASGFEYAFFSRD